MMEMDTKTPVNKEKLTLCYLVQWLAPHEEVQESTEVIRQNSTASTSCIL